MRSYPHPSLILLIIKKTSSQNISTLDLDWLIKDKYTVRVVAAQNDALSRDAMRT